MSGEQELERALLLMEFGNLEAAETHLNKAITASEEEEDDETLITAMCCMADFLYSENRDDEVLAWIEKVMAFADDEELCQALPDEFAMAREFHAELAKTKGGNPA